MKFDLNDVYQDFKSLMENSIKAQFAESKSIPPVLFIGIESKSEVGKIEAAILPADEFLQDVNGKNALSNLVKQIVKENKPVFVALIVEAYMVKLNIGEAFDDVAPSEHPNKVEVVMISFEGKGFQKQLMFEINRPKTGIPYLSDAEEVPSQGTMSGRFSGFFNDAENDDSDSFGDITNEI